MHSKWLEQLILSDEQHRLVHRRLTGTCVADPRATSGLYPAYGFGGSIDDILTWSGVLCSCPSSSFISHTITFIDVQLP